MHPIPPAVYLREAMTLCCQLLLFLLVFLCSSGHSGLLSRGEWGEAMTALGYRLLESEVDLLFARYDTAKTGLLPDAVLLHDVLALEGAAPPPVDAPLPSSSPASATPGIPSGACLSCYLLQPYVVLLTWRATSFHQLQPYR